MPVKAISITKPLIEGVDTAEQLIAYCARVSNPANQNNHDTAEKLMKYLATNKHWSPFEMVHMTLEIVTTRDIARQILRHRSFAFQEFSQRYAEVVDFADYREARLQDTKNRQNSIELTDKQKDSKAAAWETIQYTIKSMAESGYKQALSMGIAKEVARAILPEGLTVSKLYMAGSLRSWIHYCALRMGNGTQKEHKEIATQCWQEIIKHFPSLQEVIN